MSFADSLTHATQRIGESTPWALIVAPVGGAMAAMWGESFAVSLLLLLGVMAWDWILGGQVGARRDHYLRLLGVTDPIAREAQGGFSFAAARHGVQGKLNILVSVMLFGMLEAWGMPLLGNPLVVIADATLPAHFDSEGRHAILGTVVVLGLALQELSSAERNRRLLGGVRIPIFSQAIGVLSRVVGRMVPQHDGPAEDPINVEPISEWYRREMAHQHGRKRRQTDVTGHAESSAPATMEAPPTRKDLGP